MAGPWPLRPHPDNPPAMPYRIAAAVAGLPGPLTVTYTIEGDIAALRLPTAASPAPADALWQTTCCELFAAGGDGSYREFNFSPSGQWAGYDFAGYRHRKDLPFTGPRPAIGCRAGTEAFQLTATLPAAAIDDACRLGIAVVLETRDGRLGHWALAHAAGKPDFHHRDAFVVDVAGDLRP